MFAETQIFLFIFKHVKPQAVLKFLGHERMQRVSLFECLFELQFEARRCSKYTKSTKPRPSHRLVQLRRVVNMTLRRRRLDFGRSRFMT